MIESKLQGCCMSVQMSIRKRVYTPYMFLLPAVLTIGVVIIGPLLLAFFMTLNTVNLIQDSGKFVFNGLKNYKQLFTDERALNSLNATLQYVIGAVSLEVILGVGISLLLNREFSGKNAVRSLLLVSFFITPVVGALIWNMFYEPTTGLFNYLLSLLGIPPINWLGSSIWAMISIIAVDAWMTVPFMILIILASMEGIPNELYEAARVDGAKPYHLIKYITIPLASKAIIIATILRTIDALKSFDIIYILTQGGPGGATETLNMYSYAVGFKYFKLGYATTIAFVFTICVTVSAGFIINRANGRKIKI